MTRKGSRPATLGGPFATRLSWSRPSPGHNDPQTRFLPLLERLVDVGTPGQPIRRTRCRCSASNLADGREGVAHINYESNFAESCLIINEYDQHQTSLAFRLDGDALIFDVELPIAWNHPQ